MLSASTSGEVRVTGLVGEPEQTVRAGILGAHGGEPAAHRQALVPLLGSVSARGEVACAMERASIRLAKRRIIRDRRSDLGPYIADMRHHSDDSSVAHASQAIPMSSRPSRALRSHDVVHQRPDFICRRVVEEQERRPDRSYRRRACRRSWRWPGSSGRRATDKAAMGGPVPRARRVRSMPSIKRRCSSTHCSGAIEATPRTTAPTSSRGPMPRTRNEIEQQVVAGLG